MSETVSITKECEVEVKVYQVACNIQRHGELGFAVEADRDGDLIIAVDPCPDCVREAKEARDE